VLGNMATRNFRLNPVFAQILKFSSNSDGYRPLTVCAWCSRVTFDALEASRRFLGSLVGDRASGGSTETARHGLHIGVR